MTRYRFALAGAVVCFITTFVIVPVLILFGLPHPGYWVPTIGGIALLFLWARGCRT
jgi:hypothetical protein